ncbi:hypothetical protein [Chryseobacterium indoltheticum]|uniref:hypothetical protein n=1 Tax=Chryseobacterium indoltheticum TaxID=254 RepID=UPI003F498115
MNNVHYLSANYLTNIDKKKEWELKANANYTNNSVEREDNVETVYAGTANQAESTITTTTKEIIFIQIK